MARGNVFGYETYMICEDGFSNIERHGRVVGFNINLRIANYRGYVLSQIEDIKVSVEPVARSSMRVKFGNKEYTLDQMETVTDDRWELKQVAAVTCLKRGGLAAGRHVVAVEEHIRASYLPFVAVAHATKTLTLASRT
jgi:hypothetical protein